MLGGSTNDLSMKILELASRNEVIARRMEEAKSLESLFNSSTRTDLT